METAWGLAKPVKWAQAARDIARRDSIENKVLEFFDRNPDEELAASDVVAKYGGASLDRVAEILRSMKARGLLVKRREGRLHLYRRADR